MLYPTLSQPLIFFILFLTGVLSGVFFDIAKILKCLSKKKNFLFQFFLFVATVLSFFLFYEVNLNINYGQLRFYTFIAFLIGLTVEQFFSNKLIANYIKNLYNRLCEKRKKSKNSKD